jgi:hypothetical protein
MPTVTAPPPITASPESTCSSRASPSRRRAASRRPASRRGAAVVASLGLAASLALVACGSEDSGRTTALFELATGPDQDLFALPFPNELRRRADGSIDLARLGHGQPPLVQLWFDAASRVGFSRNAAAYFRFSGPIDPACLPRSPAASLMPGASVYWVNIDRRSRAYRQRIPVRLRFAAEAGLYIGGNALAVLPVSGFALEANTRYAAIVADALCDPAGHLVQPAADFVALLADATPAKAELVEAHRTYLPLREYLRDTATTGVVAAAMFTTNDAAGLPGRAREVVWRRAAPVAENMFLAQERVKLVEIQGSYVSPCFQQGTPPYLTAGGGMLLDAGGLPAVARDESLRFALTVPKGTMPEDGWPIVLHAHGTGGDFRSFIDHGEAADNLAAVKNDAGELIASFAMIGIDQPLHGARAAGDPSLTFYNIQNPTALVHNALQAAADDYSLLRLVKGLSIGSLDWAAGSGKTGTEVFDPPIRFDPKRIYFMGHSQGTFTGIPFLAYEPEIRAAVLSGAGGGAALELLEREHPINTRELFSVALREPLDVYHPAMSLIQAAAEGSEPLNYGRMLIRHRAPGVGPKHLYMSQGFVDHFVPNATTDALATAVGAQLLGAVVRDVEGLALQELADAPLPAAGNLSVDGTAVTAGLLQYRARATGKACKVKDDCGERQYCDNGLCRYDGHYATYYDADAVRHYTRFLATLARDGVPVLGP